jgi:hypothetical protein
MLHPDAAREKIQQYRVKKGAERCAAALGKLPRQLATAGLAFFCRDSRSEPIRDYQDQAAALADAAEFLDGCAARDRRRVFAALFPRLEPALEGAWQLHHRLPYAYGSRQ